MKPGSNQADDSYLGYVAQGLYALVLLFDADDGEGVSIETRDDVELVGTKPSLHQIKHSMGTPDAITVKNDKLWNTIRIWASYVNDPIAKFVYVSCANISSGSSLRLLDPSYKESSPTSSELDQIVSDFVAEARRVIQARADATTNGSKMPYQERAPGCEAFIKLSDTDRRSLVKRMVVRPGSKNAEQLGAAVEHELSGKVVAGKRLAVATRLMEWWQQQIYYCLIKKRHPVIYKNELEAMVHELIALTHETSLPDDYSGEYPDAWESLVTPVVKMQIDLVHGGHKRIERAVVERWRAASQRQRWLDDKLENAARLDKFDKSLEREWRNRHDDMANDCLNAPEETLCQEGRQLLDWSHYKAPNEIPAPRPSWREPFLVRGSFQMLSERLTVGWHRDFKERVEAALGEDREGGDDT